MNALLRCLRAGALLALVAAIPLAGCNDPTTAGVGGEGTGGFGVVGRVDGFGSTIVEGRRLDDADALVTVDGTDGGEVPLTAIKLGSQVQALSEADKLQRASVEAELIGPLEADSEENLRFTVLGQRVLLDAHPALRPVLDGVLDLVESDVVEVHGMRLANGSIAATRVQARSASLQSLRVRGEVSALDTAARRFRLGALVVSYAGSALTPASTSLANGSTVTVSSDRGMLAGGVLTARSVRIEQAASDGELLLSGFVTAYQSPSQLRVRGLPVDASAARFAAGAGAADLRNDALLRVRGRMAGGTLRAEEIAVLRTAADAPIDVTAPISDFSGADNVFRLRGATVRLGTSTQLAGGSVDNLGNGVLLRVTGSIVDGDIAAARIEWVRPSPVIAGTVTALDAATGTLTLPPLAVPVRLSAATIYRNGTAADLVNGRRVRISGTPRATDFAAAEISFLDAVNAPLVVILAGISSDVLVGDRIFVNDTQVSFNAQTVIIGGATGTSQDLDGGQYLIVRAQRQGNGLIARTIEIRATLDDDFDNVIGYVSQFTSAGALRVAGQRVDARNAVFVGGTAADLRDTAFVLAEGTVSGGILVARRIEFLPN